MAATNPGGQVTKVVGLNPDGGEYVSTIYTVELDSGAVITVDRWANRNSSGVEYYKEGGPLPADLSLTDEEIEDIAELREDADDKYWALYHERVKPILLQIHEEVFGVRHD